MNCEIDSKHSQINIIQSENKALTENLWKEQAKYKSLESELHDLRLHLKIITSENSELKQLYEREKSANLQSMERTRAEIDRMRER